MSRWRQDPNGAAAELLRRSLSALDLTGATLLANAGGIVADALRQDGLKVATASRRVAQVTGRQRRGLEDLVEPGDRARLGRAQGHDAPDVVEQ